MNDSGWGVAVVGLARFARRMLAGIVQMLAIIILGTLSFLLAVVYGILWVIRRSLPWLLRAACVILWTLGLCAGFSGVAQLYGEIADPLPMISVSVAAVIPIVVTPALALLFARKQVWGAFVFAAFAGLVEWLLAANAHSFSNYRVIASALPPVLASMITIYLAARFKSERRSNV